MTIDEIPAFVVWWRNTPYPDNSRCAGFDDATSAECFRNCMQGMTGEPAVIWTKQEMVSASKWHVIWIEVMLEDLEKQGRT